MAAQEKRSDNFPRVKNGSNRRFAKINQSNVDENWRKKQDDSDAAKNNQSSDKPFKKTDRQNFPLKNTHRNFNNSTKPMGFKQLQDLLYEEPSFIITSLANPKLGFNILASDHPVRPDLLLLIIQVLSRMVQSELYQLKIKVLSETMTEKMMGDIKKYAESAHVKNGPKQVKSVESFFRNTLQVFDACITSFPSSFMNEQFKHVLAALSLSMNKAKVKVKISDEIFDMLRDINEQVSFFIDNSKSRIDEEESKSAPLRDTEALNRYRLMELVPTKRDLTGPKAFLRKNVVQGSYENCEDYLDVQFRLLREDFIDPLRRGINEYHQSMDNPGCKQRISNFRIYSTVKFIGTSNDDSFGFRIHFDVERKMRKNVNWESNKLFSSGSLLLLTQNDFKDFFVATVTSRNIQHLKRGIVTIAFVPGTARPGRVFGPGVFFVMAESDVFYEAYRPVLSVLQKLNEPTFPMKKYIVDVNTDRTPPKYLKKETKYVVGGQLILRSLIDHVCTMELDYFPKKIKDVVGGYRFNVLDESSWPSSKLLELNASQHRAFKSALTNEFAVIQGPPGTGKTHLALKITETLLKSQASNDTPIVVICYTNHALDQFLEGILSYTDSLIRIGYQSKNEALEEYSLDAVRRQRDQLEQEAMLGGKKKKRRQRRYIDLYRDTVEEKQDLRSNLERIKKEVAEIDSANGILEINVLKHLIPRHHHDELAEQIVVWLFFEDHHGWVYEEAQGANYLEEELVFNPNLDDDNATEYSELEDITRRLADLMDDNSIIGEDEIQESHYKPKVKYSFYLPDAEDELFSLRKKLLECQNFQNNNYQLTDLYYHVQNLKERIQLIQCKINHFKHEASKFQHYQYNGEIVKEFKAVNSVWDIEPSRRWEHYWTWIHLHCCQLNETTVHMINRYQELAMQLNEVRQLDDAELIRKADIVGLTTSGAARRRVLLEKLNTKIVIVEEAAEVLEAHIVTALTSSVQHVILIGDHKQLRPNPAVYELAKKFNLEISLFERMINNGLDCSTLTLQHRMRPEIASLICPAIYADLQNHPSTCNREKISGIDKFLFFLNHNHPEDQVPNSTSRRNQFEADFLIELCQYLLSNGYKPHEVTILATYVGQVSYMCKTKKRLAEINPDWKDVRITSVDNFQGEENKIILLSLVRSNTENRIGFLSTENRVCVALSRARDGLYIVGNMDNLTASSDIWPKIHDQLLRIRAIGAALPLRCERHPEQVTLASSAEHISAIPDGGCTLMCEFELSCGHVCPRVCHIINKEHEFYECRKPCERRTCSEETHKCPLDCSRPCEPCEIPVDKLLPCGHTESLPCHEDPASYSCPEMVPVQHPDCGHDMEKRCSDDIAKCKCPEKCTFRLLCGHTCERECHVKDDVDHAEYKCMKPCDKQNPQCRRQHPCEKRCHEQCGECVVLVRAELPCTHWEQVQCHVDETTVVCVKPCKKLLSCGHKCHLPCCKPCDPSLCVEKVDKAGPCGHTFKNVSCNETFTSGKQKCQMPCAWKLACGHPCTEKCFKDCSKVECRVMVESAVAPACGHPPVKIACRLNKPDMNPGSDVLLQLCKVKCEAVLACGHVCEGSCSGCMNGRLHQPCQQQCAKRLICGHMCTAKCCKLCPPCQAKDCFSNCVHERCASVKGKRSHCSTPCEPCTKPCVWACKHQQCTRQCGQTCNRTVCDEPCTLLLPCGHECAGYCGEVCPPVCRTCDPDNQLFTDAYSLDARFVLLEDCNHVVEATQLKKMISATTAPRVGALLLCPTCSHPIVKTKRCRDVHVRFTLKYKQMQDAVRDEQQRFMRVYTRSRNQMENRPTCSATTNALLRDCYNQYKGNFFNKVMLVQLYLPLVSVYAEIKRESQQLSFEDLERVRLRLDYLALCLRSRLEDISCEDIAQIELEIFKTVWLLSGNPNVDWFDLTPFTREQHAALRQKHTETLPLNRMSENLKTRDMSATWFECDKRHLYVSRVAEVCPVCDSQQNK